MKTTFKMLKLICLIENPEFVFVSKWRFVLFKKKMLGYVSEEKVTNEEFGFHLFDILCKKSILGSNVDVASPSYATSPFLCSPHVAKPVLLEGTPRKD